MYSTLSKIIGIVMSVVLNQETRSPPRYQVNGVDPSLARTMTLKQIEAFYWAATLGSFAAAAARLHLTPSTLSKRIAELEEELDSRLLDRSSQRALLTAAGEKLIDSARHMLQLQSQIKADLTANATFRGRCRFGISELVASTWFPAFVGRVRTLYPDLLLEPHVDLTERCERKLERGELDFAVIPGPSKSPQLRGETIATLDYAWCASPERLPPNTKLTREHFIEHPVILLEPQARLTHLINRWASAQHLEIKRALTCNSLSALIELTISGVGISFFPLAFVDPLVRRGLLCTLGWPIPLPKLTYYFQQRGDDSRSLLLALKQLVLEAVDFHPPRRS